MDSKLKKVIQIALTGVISLLLFGFVVVSMSSRQLIINYGVRGYENIKISIICAFITFVVVLIGFSVVVKIKTKNLVDYVADEKLVARANNTLTELRKLQGKSSDYYEEIGTIYQDLNMVLDYYTSIGVEIRESGYHELSDADDILYKVLVSMLCNIDHLVRVLHVLNKKDTDKLNEEVNNCKTLIGDMKNKALDFITSILDYMHNSDSGNMALAFSYVNNYKKVILGEIDTNLISKYLKDQN